MPIFTRITLYNMSPFHIGRGTDYYDLSAPSLSSDMLSAALAAMRAMEGRHADLDAFLQSFALSAAFPYAQGHYFLPRLTGRLKVEVAGTDEAACRKQLKRIRFVEQSLWMRIASDTQTVKIDQGQICGHFLLSSDDTNFRPPVYTTTMQRVSVPRNETEDTEPFFFQWNFVKPDAGLYCLLQCDEQQMEEIVSLFTELGKTGIGSDKNVGGGHFKVKAETLDIPHATDANGQVLLSTYIPTSEELNRLELPRSRYELNKIGGFMAGSSEETFRHLHRRSIYAFCPGSVFATTSSLQGRVVNLAPAWNDKRMHPVWRSGRALSINIKLS